MVFYEVIAKQSSVTEGSVTIDELNGALNEISKNMSKGWAATFVCLLLNTILHSQSPSNMQCKIMWQIYNRTTPKEQKWIVHIILRGVTPVL